MRLNFLRLADRMPERMRILQRRCAGILCCILMVSLLCGGNTVQGKTVKDAKAAKSASSKTSDPYLIQVNKGTNVVTVYAQNSKGKYTVPKKAFICSTGEDTPVGTFKTPNKFRWQPLMNDVWGQYCTQISGNYLFHSVYYDSKNPADLNIRAYNMLGTTCSHGCIRLTCGDAKWIYDNCPLGTTVRIVDGTKKDDPLGKPKAMKIQTGWDPTDPDPDNPWHNQLLKITYNGPSAVEYNTDLKDLQSYVTVQDVCRTDVSKKKYLKVSGKVNTKKLGKYKITYTATDKNGKVTKKECTIRVRDTKKPVLTGVESVTVERNASFNAKKGVSARMVSGKRIKKSKIRVSGAKVDTSVVGTYTLTYSVKGTNHKERTATRKVQVVDTQAPMIQNLENGVLHGAWQTLSQAERTAQIQSDVLARIRLSDNGKEVKSMDSWITVQVTPLQSEVYSVNVTARDPSGNVSQVTVQYTLSDVAQ